MKLVLSNSENPYYHSQTCLNSVRIMQDKPVYQKKQQSAKISLKYSPQTEKPLKHQATLPVSVSHYQPLSSLGSPTPQMPQVYQPPHFALIQETSSSFWDKDYQFDAYCCICESKLGTVIAYAISMCVMFVSFNRVLNTVRFM